jgi:Predicted restriction endonuclease
MDNELRVKYYSNQLLKLNCAHAYGRKILAKPIFVLTIISAIEEGFVNNNKFFWKGSPGFDEFHQLYQSIYVSYQPNECLTPMYKPFYHLKNDGFWHHDVKDQNNIPKTATNKYLKENLNYAYLDQALWDLLQDHNVREEFRNQIINFFLRPNNN